MTYNFDIDGTHLTVEVTHLYKANSGGFGLSEAPYGLLSDKTNILLHIPENKNIAIEPETTNPHQELLRVDFSNIEELGVGGLDEVMGQMLELIVLPHLLPTDQLAMLHF